MNQLLFLCEEILDHLGVPQRPPSPGVLLPGRRREPELINPRLQGGVKHWEMGPREQPPSEGVPRLTTP